MRGELAPTGYPATLEAKNERAVRCAEAPRTEDCHWAQKRYLTCQVRHALTSTGGFLSGFGYSLNPYIGCAFGNAGGCPYCYVRTLPVARAASGAWGSWVIAKTNLPEVLQRELHKLRTQGRLGESTIFLSSATDPYQGIERRFRLTRRALELFVDYPPRRIVLQTRSPLIERDADLIVRLGSAAIVSITLETDDDKVRRLLTPTSPSVERRLRLAKTLRERGIFVQLAIAPMMPNDPQRFANLVAPLANRVIIDTYTAGDGACGRRSLSLGIDALYDKLGYSRWFGPDAHLELMREMQRRLGADRVLFSKEGFNAV